MNHSQIANPSKNPSNKLQRSVKAIIVIASIVGLAGICVAAVPAKKAKTGSKAVPAMTPEMMKKAMKNGSPGPHHAKLESIVGEFTYVAKMWMSPSSEAMESSGKSTNAWVLGKRFVMQQVTGTWSGQAFEGLGYTGYDNVKQEIVSVWLDSMATGMMIGSGKMAASGDFTSAGTFSCPMTGSDKPFKTETKITGPNSHVYTAYHNGPNGKPYKAMEITYTRAGAKKTAKTTTQKNTTTK